MNEEKRKMDTEHIMKLYWWAHPVCGYWVVVAESGEEARRVLLRKIENGVWKFDATMSINHINNHEPYESVAKNAIYLG